jgi:hypothetical protein
MKLVKEHIDFQRRLKPKEAMGIGANDPERIKCIEYFLSWLYYARFPEQEEDCGPYLSIFFDEDTTRTEMEQYTNFNQDTLDVEDIWKGFLYLTETWPANKNLLKKYHITLYDIDTDGANFQMPVKHWKDLKRNL